MVVQKDLSEELVIITELWKRETHDVGLERFGISRDKVESPQNGLILHHAVANAFYRKQICFVFDDFVKKIFQIAAACFEESASKSHNKGALVD